MGIASGLRAIGSHIGQGLARGEPLAFLLAALVPVAFYIACKVMVYWRTS